MSGIRPAPFRSIRTVTDVNRRRTGRPPLTDRATLLAAARRIGFVDLTVGTVTAQVGVKYSTFYRHFPSFEALVSALVDDVLAETEFPEPALPWQEHLSRTAAVLFEVLHRYPGMAQAVVSLPARPHRLVELFRHTTDVLLAAGFSGKDTILAASGTLELALMPWIDGPGPNPGGVARREYARTAPEPLDDRVRTAIVESIDDPPARWTADKIDLLIDGLEARLARSGAGSPTPGRNGSHDGDA